MLDYEKEAQLLTQKGYVSGSRTLLRLHRGLGERYAHITATVANWLVSSYLDFVYEFLNRIQAIPDDQKTVDVCKEAYDDTLGKHHSFLIRKGARLAMYAMPTRGDLLKKVCSDVEAAKENLPSMLKHMRTNYDRTEDLYTLYDLHSLP